MKPLHEFIGRTQITTIIHFQYIQILRIIGQLLSQSQCLRKMPHYGTIVTTGQMPKGFLARCYYLLIKEQEGQKLCDKWSQQFNIIIDVKNWPYWYKYSMKISCNINISENPLKMYTMWYYTPLRLARMYGGTVSCWRCGFINDAFRHV